MEHILKQSEVKRRSFLPENINLAVWSEIEPFFLSLRDRTIHSESELIQWLKDRSELESALSEHLGWKYIKMNIDTRDTNLSEAFNHFMSNIVPKVDVFTNEFNQKALANEYFNSLPDEEYYVYKRSLKNEADLFREENIALKSELSIEANEYGTIQATLEVEHEGKSYTMQQASFMLKNEDRSLRKTIFDKIVAKRLSVKDELDVLLDRLIAKRHQVAKNAGFENFRDYSFRAMERFDYSVSDCEQFHEAVFSTVLPVLKDVYRVKKEKLGLLELKPYDTDAEPIGSKTLRPFNNGDELYAKSVNCLRKVDPYFAECIEQMHEMGHMSLDSIPGKAPGGFNYPLYESGAPFIYMNNVGSQRDLVTFVHEAGHAVHSFLVNPLLLTAFKSTPSEIAELASMSMELISMEYWNEFYENESELNKAKIEQLEKIVAGLVWIATIDKFQHWLYTHPNHTTKQRTDYWREINAEVAALVDWSEYEMYNDYKWQTQLHIYEVPFYYIEYGFAQLGALAAWLNYKQNPQTALTNYKNALKLGNTGTIPKVYETAGIKFDFSKSYIKKLTDLIASELISLRS